MTSASHHFASVSCSTVLPVPKPPGIAACPPRATGKSVSRMRCPVIIGSSAGSRARDRPRLADRPAMEEADIVLGVAGVADRAQHGIRFVGAFADNAFDGAADIRRQQAHLLEAVSGQFADRRAGI